MTDVVAARLPREDVQSIVLFAKEESLDKSTFVKRLLRKSLEKYKEERALKLYSEGRISLGRAAELAERTVWDMLDLMKKHHIELQYSVEDLKDDLKAMSDL